MLCKNCGFKYSKEDKFCPECGEKTYTNNKEEEKIIISSYNRSSQEEYYRNGKTSNSIYDEYANLRPYYQLEFTRIKDSDETYKGKFNFFPFLFSWIWMLTKKMYVGAVVYIIVVGVLTSYIHGIFSLLFGTLMGFRANYMYYNYYTKGTYKIW
ncbi:DUF2628 domain-containing protein [Terrisporobacter mayombei]|uniref:Zinc ribbon domain-containing protein n=1 Tax=Terrisporobacter mayombei TaxID=1541 RepID=A0ABY9Q5S5_9FIRM|nr:hypothetical protein [Terrisporobacter mayombei]MCC3869727.1 hypothetical protein [Terrisporobacter mayombei]WMT83333.1 hypothetical protein TEMA_38440 [Terrisporobacter mayombei]